MAAIDTQILEWIDPEFKWLVEYQTEHYSGNKIAIWIWNWTESIRSGIQMVPVFGYPVFGCSLYIQPSMYNFLCLPKSILHQNMLKKH
jgi:hypothetical protein